MYMRSAHAQKSQISYDVILSREMTSHDIYNFCACAKTTCSVTIRKFPELPLMFGTLSRSSHFGQTTEQLGREIRHQKASNA